MSGGRWAVAVGGTLAAVLAAVAGGRAYTGTSVPPTRWLGLVPDHGYRPGDSNVWGVLLWVGITGLSLAWLGALRLLRRDALTARQAALTGVAWATPLAVGPPLVSKDVWAYAAQSVMQHAGLDVYRDTAADLARVPGADAARALAAVDPRWRDSTSPYGPLSALLTRFAGWASGGDPAGAAVALRVVAVLAVVALTVLATRLTTDRTAAVVLVGLNPLVLVHALSAAHVEAVMCALLVAALVLAQRARWTTAVVLAVLAGAVKAPAFLAVPAMAAAHVLATRRPADVLKDAAAALVALAAATLVVPHGWGWLGGLSTPTQGDPTSSITGHVADLAAAVLPGDDAVRTAVRALGALVALGLLVALALTFRRRPLAHTVGYGLFAVAFLAPVAYPWYVLWGLVCVLPTATGRVRTVLIALSVVEAGLSIPGASGAVTGTLTSAVLVAAVLAVVVSLRRSDAASPRTP